ncbi:MAG: hypothetical protein Q9221_007097 [Calogaya cf. arnoldii]
MLKLEPIETQNNNLLEIFFDQALEQAQRLDQYMDKTNQTIGPLHGLPISLKDQFHVKGVDTSMAYVGWIGTFEGEKGTGKERNVNSELVRELQELGAVLIAKLSFGIMRTDGVVAPHPPITRALRTVIEAVEAAGYETLTWEPPAHRKGAELHSTILDADGRADVFQQLSLSGEPLISELVPEFGHEPLAPMPLLNFYDQVLQLKAFRNEYAAYWASTAEKTKSGISCSSFQIESIVGQVELTSITGKWYHYDYSTIANTLDYTTVVIPVTFADKKLDPFDDTYQPLNEKDKKNWLAYDAEAYDGAPAAVQLLGRRLEEEKLLEIADLVMDALKKSSDTG